MTKKKEESVLVLRKDVCQSNPLVQARKNFDMIATRIFFLGLRGLNPHFSENDRYYDMDFKEMFIPTSKLTELFGGNTWYLHDLEKVCDEMFHTVIKLRPADGGLELYHLFRKLKYVKNEGLYIWFEELLRPYILDLVQSRGYTRINVEYLFKLSSPYAVRILELLLQYQNIKDFKELMEIKRTLTTEELRFSLNVPEDAYRNRMNNFRKYVLDDPIKEINTRTPYIVRYNPIKEGRKVVAFEFTMDTYKVPVEALNGYKPDFTNDAIKLLCSLGFNEQTAQAIFKKCADVQDCFARVNRAQNLLKRQKKPVANKLGFLRKAIEENWQIGGKPTSSGKSAPQRKVAASPQQSKSAEEQPQLPPKPLKIGRQTIPHGLAKTYMEAIRKGEHLDRIKNHLKEFNVTVEKFIQACEKHGL